MKKTADDNQVLDTTELEAVRKLQSIICKLDIS